MKISYHSSLFLTAYIMTLNLFDSFEGKWLNSHILMENYLNTRTQGFQVNLGMN